MNIPLMNIPLNIDFQQVLLHLLNFAILGFGLYFLLYSPVKKFMDKRSEHFESLEKTALERESAAAAAKENYEKLIGEADEEIRRRKSDELEAAAVSAQRRIDAAKEQAAAIVETAKAEALTERKKIVDGAQGDIAEMVVAAAERLAGGSVSPEADRALYDRFLESAGKDTDGDGDK